MSDTHFAIAKKYIFVKIDETFSKISVALWSTMKYLLEYYASTIITMRNVERGNCQITLFQSKI